LTVFTARNSPPAHKFFDGTAKCSGQRGPCAPGNGASVNGRAVVHYSQNKQKNYIYFENKKEINLIKLNVNPAAPQFKQP
jgi:hypothetical protein